MPREMILGAHRRGSTAPPPEPLPPASYRADRWRDGYSKTFHIFPAGALAAVCGVKRRGGWTTLKCTGHKTCRICRANRANQPGEALKPVKPRKPVLVNVDRDDLAGVVALAGKRGRNQFIRDAIREKLQRGGR